jgi:sulfur-oxidizing protein SoxA
MSPALRAMQDDDGANPGMLWVEEGRARWSAREGADGRACADCHGPTPQTTMRGVAADYPKWDAPSGRPITLAGRIAACRERHQRLAPRAAADTPALLALHTAVAHASRATPVRPAEDPRMTPWRERGRALWHQRIGQLDLSCADCHDDLVGGRLGGSLIPPGNAAGYPTYRLEWQTLDDVTRRLRNCTTGVRAEAWASGADEWLALQVWMAWRDRGMAIQTPAVRP